MQASHHGKSMGCGPAVVENHVILRCVLLSVIQWVLAYACTFLRPPPVIACLLYGTFVDSDRFHNRSVNCDVLCAAQLGSTDGTSTVPPEVSNLQRVALSPLPNAATLQARYFTPQHVDFVCIPQVLGSITAENALVPPPPPPSSEALLPPPPPALTASTSTQPTEKAPRTSNMLNDIEAFRHSALRKVSKKKSKRLGPAEVCTC